MIVAHRSRSEAFQNCPRKGYFSYLYKGRGIERKGFDPDMLIGGSVHKGVEWLLGGAEENRAAGEAIKAFSIAVNEIGLAPMVVETALGFETVGFSPEQESFMINLVEALVRGFARVRLPRLLEEYEILSVEREEEYALAPEITYLTRSDFISRRRLDGTLFIHNLKTVKWPDGAWRKKFHYDQQTLSELLGPEARLGQKFGGVIIEGLVKGIKNIEYPKGSGIRYNNSPLVWAWQGPANDPFPADLKVKYEYTDDWGKQRRLGPNYTRVPAYKVMPIRDWIDKIQREDPALLEAQFVTLPPVLRNDAEIGSWKTSTISEEMETAMGANYVEDNPNTATLDQWFPKHTSNGNCLGYGDTTCPFFKICWEGASPDDPDLYMPRRFNHPKEAELNAK